MSDYADRLDEIDRSISKVLDDFTSEYRDILTVLMDLDDDSWHGVGYGRIIEANYHQQELIEIDVGPFPRHLEEIVGLFNRMNEYKQVLYPLRVPRVLNLKQLMHLGTCQDQFAPRIRACLKTNEESLSEVITEALMYYMKLDGMTKSAHKLS